MRNGKRLTKNQKVFIKKNGYNPDDYLLIKVVTPNREIVLKHKTTGEVISVFNYDPFWIY